MFQAVKVSSLAGALGGGQVARGAGCGQNP